MKLLLSKEEALKDVSNEDALAGVFESYSANVYFIKRVHIHVLPNSHPE